MHDGKLNQTIEDEATGYQTKVEGGHTNVGGIHNHIYPSTEKPTSLPKKVLLLSADPLKEESSRRQTEVLEIEGAIYRATRSRKENGRGEPILECSHKPRLEAQKLSQELSAMEPYIVDISGFTDGLAALCIGKSLEAKVIQNSDEPIAKLFRLHSEHIKCLVLNGCYTEEQAKTISEYVRFIIGISQGLSDKASAIFLSEFYFQIAVGRSIRDSYESGCNRLERFGTTGSKLLSLLDREEERKEEIRKKELLYLDRKIEEHPFDYENKVKKGDILEKAGKHDKAVSVYSKALDLEEQDYRVWWKKGKVLAKLEKLSEARKCYENALFLRPDAPDNYVMSREFGLILESMAALRESVNLHTESLRAEPKYRVSKYDKRRVYKKLYFERNKAI